MEGLNGWESLEIRHLRAFATIARLGSFAPNGNPLRELRLRGEMLRDIVHDLIAVAEKTIRSLA
jgi:hypothetical protein